KELQATTGQLEGVRFRLHDFERAAGENSRESQRRTVAGYANGDALARAGFFVQVFGDGDGVGNGFFVDGLDDVADREARTGCPSAFSQRRGSARNDNMDLCAATQGGSQIQPAQVSAKVFDGFVPVQLDAFDSCSAIVKIKRGGIAAGRIG